MNNEEIGMSAAPRSRVLQVNGKRFAAGLWWTKIQSIASARKEMLEIGRAEGQNLGTLYSGLDLQAGFVSVPPSEVKAFEGAWALASVLATKLGQSWLGVFDLGDGNYALVAVRDGQIVPGSDAVGDYDTIRMTLADVASMQSDWGTLYLTDQRFVDLFDGSNISARSLSDILSEKRWDKKLKLQTLSGGLSPSVLVVGALVALAVLGTIGYLWYSRHMESVELERIQAEDAARLSQQARDERAKALALVDERTIKPHWPALPAAADVLTACRQSMFQMPMSLNGWVLSEITCDANATGATYLRRDGATMLDFQTAAEALRKAQGINSFSLLADRATVRLGLPAKPARGEEKLPKYGPWSIAWLSHLQKLNIASELTHAVHAEPPPPERSLVSVLGKEKSAPPPPWWETYTWTITMNDVDIFDVLETAVGPGMVIRKISVNTESPMQWKWVANGETNVQN
ncbi:Pilin accessory protein (PilO) [Achromobacter sp. 2789STDY5608633]|uniref:type 4b pilus protein PilO2 n=1 Tax=Pseudomonadota TaxID=1224 RepID=UPI0006C5CDBA|nr:type 4b pilus protein PilO2 [Achromobacter sp. 2789STDY5608633]CUJ50881.1 Pilin accessory protein (PilO) [Achromobacter sp. 2789STDY5608633]